MYIAWQGNNGITKVTECIISYLTKFTYYYAILNQELFVFNSYSALTLLNPKSGLMLIFYLDHWPVTRFPGKAIKVYSKIPWPLVKR
jgi:hypothetical protein